MTQRSPISKPPAGAAERIYDELLVTMIWAGDRRAMDRLAARWQPRLIRTASRYLGSGQDANAAVQEAWISILKGIHGLKDPARFAAWAYGILRRRCADMIRKATNRRSVQIELADGDSSEVTKPLDGVAIRVAFNALPADQRFAAHLFFVEGLTLAEISEAQEVPLGTAKSRLFHARRQLKTALSDPPPGDDQ
ncbi:RNA polymerase sigma factor [Pontixanthobacter aquaemixtae]|uniref:Sigma-70 family RNA polymerase sigma factor n=1 Tax=Pontixanthobacter aquaemixtae TaxID=1958940 RepID=A0A844ZPC1_9SPHN|nr:sigma-70 family RNA polymerase sigma factor [Pontixanthobacter aquaemixtae]MXO89588.1 sigma-70 family RNA polymerase sigma factor [Pontixanthobacter aquaemixtae]